MFRKSFPAALFAAVTITGLATPARRRPSSSPRLLQQAAAAATAPYRSDWFELTNYECP